MILLECLPKETVLSLIKDLRTNHPAPTYNGIVMRATYGWVACEHAIEFGCNPVDVVLQIGGLMMMMMTLFLWINSALQTHQNEKRLLIIHSRNEPSSGM